MLSRKEVRGRRVITSYRLRNKKLFRGPYLPRERVSFRVRPSTVELIKWLTKKGWGTCPSRAVDHFTRRYYWWFFGNKKFPHWSMSTKDVLDFFVEQVREKRDFDNFPDFWLYVYPNRSRMLDYLAAFWYHYHGGKRRTS